jgi:hypothetical protein
VYLPSNFGVLFQNWLVSIEILGTVLEVLSKVNKAKELATLAN